MNICFYNGKFVGNRNIVSLYNGSFLYGINCFEGLRGYWDSTTNKLYLLDLDNHLNRLFDSASRLKLSHGLSKEYIKSQLNLLVLHQDIKENVYMSV